jgi:hypothetical protein
MTKYNSKKCQWDGYDFDSKDEMLYYLLLKQRLADGEIAKLILQPKYELVPKFEKNGVKSRAMCYSPDFEIWHHDGTIEVIDVKGMATQQGDMRRKLFDFYYPNIKLTWISRSIKYGENGWIEYDELKKCRKRKE